MFNISRSELHNTTTPQNSAASDLEESNIQSAPESDKNSNSLSTPTAISGGKITPEKFLSAMKKYFENENSDEIHIIFSEDKILAESLIGTIKKYDHVVKKIIQQGVDYESPHDPGLTQLFAACKNRKNIQVIKLLLFAGADINKRCEENRTVLMAACKSRNAELVELLISLGCDIDAVDDNGISALKIATEMRDIPILKILLENGANVNATDRVGLEILSCAVRNDFYIFDPLKSLEVVGLLIKYGADVNNRASKLPIFQSGIPGPLFRALAVSNPNTKMIELLLERGADVLQKGIDGKTIFEGCEQGLSELNPENKMVIQAHWKKLVPDSEGFGTQKIVRVTSQNLQNLAARAYVVHLCESKDNASAVNDDSVAENDVEAQDLPETEILEIDNLVNDILIENINAFQADGRTYMTIAAGAGDSGEITTDFLLKSGANLHQPDKHGNSPLIAAAMADEWDTVFKLIEHGAHLNQTNAQTGGSVLWAAFISENMAATDQAELIAVLIEKGASLDLPNPEKKSEQYWPKLEDVLNYCHSLKWHESYHQNSDNSST